MSVAVWCRGSYGWMVCPSTPEEELPDDLQAEILRACLDRGANRWAVGFDHRSGARSWAERLATELATRGHNVVLATQACPLAGPALAIQLGTAEAALVVTGLSEPVDCTGIVVIPVSKSPRLPQRVGAAHAQDAAADRVSRRDFRSDLLNFYRGLARTRELRSAQLQVLIDANGGVGDRLLEEVLRDNVARVATIYGLPLPTFYNRPVLPQGSDLFELSLQVGRGKWHLGIALSGGGEALAVVDEKGTPVDPGDLQLLLLESALRQRAQTTVLVSEGVTRRAERLARQERVTLRRVTAGMWGVSAAVATEGSDGRIGLGELGQLLTGKVSVPDGIFSALVLLQGLARKRVPLSEWVEDVRRRLGRSRLVWRLMPHDEASGRRLTNFDVLEVPGFGRLEKVLQVELGDTQIEAKWTADKGDVWIWILGSAGRLRVFAEAPEAGAAEALLGRVESLLQ